eukprot:1785239-Pleurochrysis_carterae.AAC.7
MRDPARARASVYACGRAHARKCVYCVRARVHHSQVTACNVPSSVELSGLRHPCVDEVDLLERRPVKVDDRADAPSVQRLLGRVLPVSDGDAARQEGELEERGQPLLQQIGAAARRHGREKRAEVLG